jgi:hypothetical protein
MIKGVIFDMDGVLADSEKFICKAAMMMFSEIGLKVQPDDFRPKQRCFYFKGFHILTPPSDAGSSLCCDFPHFVQAVPPNRFGTGSLCCRKEGEVSLINNLNYAYFQ